MLNVCKTDAAAHSYDLKTVALRVKRGPLGIDPLKVGGNQRLIASQEVPSINGAAHQNDLPTFWCHIVRVDCHHVANREAGGQAVIHDRHELGSAAWLTDGNVIKNGRAARSFKVFVQVISQSGPFDNMGSD